LRFQIGSGVDAIVQVSRERDGRRVVTHISEVAGYNGKEDAYRVRHIFQRDYGDGSNQSWLAPTGTRPHFAERMLEHGTRLPDELEQLLQQQERGVS
jgi:pilus assembly protein CpaF